MNTLLRTLRDKMQCLMNYLFKPYYRITYDSLHDCYNVDYCSKGILPVGCRSLLPTGTPVLMRAYAEIETHKKYEQLLKFRAIKPIIVR